MRITLVVLLLIIILTGNTVFAASPEEELVKAEILEVSEVNPEIPEYRLSLRILEGTFNGSMLEIAFSPIQYSEYDFIPQKGASVIIRVAEDAGSIRGEVVSLARQDNLLILFGIFAFLLIIFGKRKGFVSLLALAVSGLLMFMVLIPMALNGSDVVIVTVGVTVLIIIISFLLLSGFSKRSLASILGTVGGIISAVLVSEIFCRLCGITGSISEEAYLLISQVESIDMDFAGVFISGVIIGTIGVVIDTSMSITSVIFELKSNSPKISFQKLVASGLNVGKDMTATMITTLIMAYVGTSMPLFYFFVFNASSLSYIVNQEIVAGEIIRSLCGGIGIVLTVPLTSLAAGYLALKEDAKPYLTKRNR